LEWKLLELIAKGGTGFPYILLATAIWWIYALQKKIETLWNERLSDKEKLLTALEENSKTIDTIMSASDDRIEVWRAMSDAQKEIKHTLATMAMQQAILFDRGQKGGRD
jgi:hypothetical protein